MTIKLFRHKVHKDIFLARNWSYCGGDENTEFYYATKDVFTAVKDANRPVFKKWFSSFLDEDGKTKLKARITDRKTVDIDGYFGTVEKELVFPVVDFELVELTEVDE